MARPARVGAVSYLNARPLIDRLEEVAPEVELTLDVPSRLADRLHAGDLDVALIPSIEYLRGVAAGGSLVVLPDLAIAARGAVRSVKLFSRVPLDRIERLGLDEGSRTSQALVQVWLNARYGVRPPVVEIHPLGVPIQESLADAVLLIGDRSMKTPGDGFVEVVDMGRAWVELTGLPFVFAFWTARAEADLGDLPERLIRLRDDNLRRAEEIAGDYGPRLGLDRATCVDYLTKVLSYELGPAEIRGFRRFAAMAADLGLAPEGVDLVFLSRGGPLPARR